jgi:hypothetical protein
MDSHKLRSLINNLLVESNKLDKYYLFKNILPSGEVFYSTTEQQSDPEKHKQKNISIAINNVNKGRAVTNFQKKIASLSDPKNELSVELVGSFETREELEAAKLKTIQNDKESINSASSNYGRFGASTDSIKLKKSDTILTKDGKVFINTLALQKDKELANSLKNKLGKGKLNMPLGTPKAGNYIEIDSKNIERI